MTLESATVEVFVSPPFSSTFFFSFFPSFLPQSTKEISLLSPVPFLKDSPGRSVQEGSLIYFRRREKREKCWRGQCSPRKILMKRGGHRVILCIGVFEMNLHEGDGTIRSIKKKCPDIKARRKGGMSDFYLRFYCSLM